MAVGEGDGRFEPSPLQALEDLVGLGESEMREFKATFQWDVRQSQLNKELRQASLKTIAAFLNTRGGTLLIGVEDDVPCVVLATICRPSATHWTSLARRSRPRSTRRSGRFYAPYYSSRFEKTGDKTICRVEVQRSAEAVFMKDAKGKEFYIRQGNTTRSLDVEDAHRYIRLHWPS